MGATDRAIAGYRRALALDAGFTPAAFNLATLYEAVGQKANAESTLLAALARTPEDAELHYSLALVRAALGKFADAALAFEEVERRNPERPRLQHNYGLVLAKLDRNRPVLRMVAQTLWLFGDVPHERRDDRRGAHRRALRVRQARG